MTLGRAGNMARIHPDIPRRNLLVKLMRVKLSVHEQLDPALKLRSHRMLRPCYLGYLASLGSRAYP